MTASSRMTARPRQWLLGALVLGGLTLAGAAQAHVFGSISLSVPPVSVVLGNTPHAAVVYGGPVYSSPVYSAPVYSTPVYSTPVYSTPVYADPYAHAAYPAPVYTGPVGVPAPFALPPVVSVNYGAPSYPMVVREYEHEHHGWPRHGGNWGWREGHHHGHGFD